MKNQRLKESPPLSHPDFEYSRGIPKGSRTEENRHWISLKQKIDIGYFDFAVCFWGAVGRISVPNSSSPGNVFYIKQNRDWVREIFEEVDWLEVVKNGVSAGAPQLTTDVMIEVYTQEVNKRQPNANEKPETK